MKKTSIIVLVIASVMLLASCGGVNEFNTPKDVIGEWKGSTSEAVVTPSYAGTYTLNKTITYPEYVDEVRTSGTTTTTYRTYNAPVSTVVIGTRTVADDYSYTQKVTSTMTQAARDAKSSGWNGSGTMYTYYEPAYTQRVRTVEVNTTSTVSKNSDGSYVEKITKTETTSGTGAFFTPTLSSVTTVTTSFVATEEDLTGYIPETFVDNTLTAGKTISYNYLDANASTTSGSEYILNLPKTNVTTSVTTTYTVQTDYNLVVGEDGTFTYTTTETKKYTAPEAKDVVVKNVYTGMATGSGDGYLTLNTKKAVYTVDAGEAVTEAFSKYDTYDYYIVNKTLQINGMPTLTLVEPAKK